jgi:hypothetical protein
MWATLALMSALNCTPAQAGELQFKNVRFTYGILGQERKDTTFLPGDMVVLAFDVEGLKVAANGDVHYSMGLEVTGKEPMDAKKIKSWYKKDPEEVATVNTLGGSRRSEFAVAETGTDLPAGEYTMKVVIADLANKKAQVTLERKFELKKPDFGIVRIGFTYLDLNTRQPGTPQLAPPLSVPGKHMLLNFAVVGFKLEGEKQQPHVTVAMEIKDETGKSVLEKPFTSETKNIGEEYKKLRVMPYQIPMQITRPGKFKIVLTAKDVLGNKTATQTLDFKVVELD